MGSCERRKSDRVVDPQLFAGSVVGTRGIVSTEAIGSFLRDIVVARLNDLLGENLKTIFDLPAYYDELAAGVKARVAEDFSKQGLELVDLIISAITPPEEVQKMIDERSGMGAIGDMNAYSQFKAAQAIQDAAKQEGGAAGQGMGLGSVWLWTDYGRSSRARPAELRLRTAACSSADQNALVGTVLLELWRASTVLQPPRWKCPACHRKRKLVQNSAQAAERRLCLSHARIVRRHCRPAQNSARAAAHLCNNLSGTWGGSSL